MNFQNFVILMHFCLSPTYPFIFINYIFLIVLNVIQNLPKNIFPLIFLKMVLPLRKSYPLLIPLLTAFAYNKIASCRFHARCVGYKWKKWQKYLIKSPCRYDLVVHEIQKIWFYCSTSTVTQFFLTYDLLREKWISKKYTLLLSKKLLF